jgi:putative colanic acid biosynthesis acetyltransferase WcaF
MTLDIEANRRAFRYTRSELLQRLLWALAQPLFRCSPRLLYGWRNALLRLFGARIGRGVRVYPSVRIFLPSLLTIGDEATVGDDARLYNLGPLHIGAQATVSQGAHLCGGSHDDRDPAFRLIRASIRLDTGCWVCADAFIGPGVTIGEGAVVGARAVATRNVEAWQVVAGNPARFIRHRSLS